MLLLASVEILQYGTLEEFWPERARRTSLDTKYTLPHPFHSCPCWALPQLAPACQALCRQHRQLQPCKAQGSSPSCLLLALGEQQQLSNGQLWAVLSGLSSASAVSYSCHSVPVRCPRTVLPAIAWKVCLVVLV